MSASENPAAFPAVGTGDYGSEGVLLQSGMTLRDWFAGQALAGFMASTKRPTTIAPDDAEWCYSIADAMLIERAKVQS